MEMSQRNSLCSYLKQTKMSFFLNKIREKKGETGPVQGEGILYQSREKLGNGCGRVNIVEILCTYVCKWKNDTC
jgi:hypothetical protein